jgi:hypothetical protein
MEEVEEGESVVKMEVDEDGKEDGLTNASSSATVSAANSSSSNPPSTGKRRKERAAGNAPRNDSDSSDEDLANEGQFVGNEKKKMNNVAHGCLWK